MKISAGTRELIPETIALTQLTIEEGCTVRGRLTVNGEPAMLAPGTYSGKLVLDAAP